MPSKALLRPAEAIAEARRIPGAAEAVTGELDVAAVLARRDQVIHDRDDSGCCRGSSSAASTVVRGAARIVGERRVDVDGRQLEARRAVVIATGSEAASRRSRASPRRTRGRTARRRPPRRCRSG